MGTVELVLELESRRRLRQDLGFCADGPNGRKLVANRGCEFRNVGRGGSVQCFRDNQDGSGVIPYGRISALSVGPTPSVGSAGLVGKNYFMRLGKLGFAREGPISLRARRVPDLDILR